MICVFGGYYAYGSYAENKYYENYRLAVYYGDKMGSIDNATTIAWNTTKFNTQDDLKKLVNESKNSSQEMLDNELQYQHYVNEMLKYTTSSTKKQYAESMLKQANITIQYINKNNEIYDLILNTNYLDQIQVTDNQNKLVQLVKERTDLENQMITESEVREKIRAQYPEFTTRLEQEAQSSENATLK